MGGVEHSSPGGSSPREPERHSSANTPPERNQAGGEGDPANLIGRQVGRYLIERFLGSGGVAAVYQAYDQVQGQSVALKMLPATADEKTLMRFRREAMTSGALRHPNIVRTLQVGMAPRGDVPYIAMELIEGQSLSALLAMRNTLNPIESCSVLEPIAVALAHAHKAGIVHRDVKPSNILLRPAEPGNPRGVLIQSLAYAAVPMLSDFGIARSLDAPDLTSTGRTVGTPAYMAPEQCAGRRAIDGRADIYSLGAVLYRCLAGRPPFSGTTTQMLHAHVYEPLQIEEGLYNQLSPQVVDILRRSLAKRPDERYGSAAEMAAALAVAAGRPITPMEETAPMERTDATATMTLSSMPSAANQQVNYTVLVPGRSPATSQGGTTRATGTPAITIAPATETIAPPTRSWWNRLEQINWPGLAALSVGTLVIAFLMTLAFNGSLRTSLGGSDNNGNGGSGIVEPPPSDIPGAAVTYTAAPTDIIMVAPSTTPTPIVAATTQPTPTLEPTSTPTATATNILVETPTLPSPTWTATPIIEPTPTPLPTWTPTALPTETPTYTPMPTATWTPTAGTPTPEITETPTPTIVPTNTPVQTPPTPTWTPQLPGGPLPLPIETPLPIDTSLPLQLPLPQE